MSTLTKAGSIHSPPPAWPMSVTRSAISRCLPTRSPPQGNKILYCNIGDPCKYDFPVPPHLLEAVVKAMKDGYNGYAESLGIKPAVEAIRNEAERDGFKNIQGIFVGLGSGEAIDSCLTALLNPGRELPRAKPGVPAVRRDHRETVAVSANAYFLDESNDWQPDVEDIERRINAKHPCAAADQSEQSNRRGVLTRNAGEDRRRCSAAQFAAHRRRDLQQARLRPERRSTSRSPRWHPMFPASPSTGSRRLTSFPDGGSAGALRLARRRASSRSSRIDLQAVARASVRAPSLPVRSQGGARRSAGPPQVGERETGHRARRSRKNGLLEEPRVNLVAPKGAFYAFPSLDIPEDDLTFVSELLKQKHVLLVHG